MAYKPILFSTEMVRTLLEGRKTQTRRIIKSRHESGLYQVSRRVSDGEITSITSLDWDERQVDPCNDIQPKYLTGDILWVRETLYQEGEVGLQYFSNDEYIDEVLIPHDFNVRVDKNGRYKFCKIPNIHMPRWASRIFLKVTNVRVERLQDISEEDAMYEGVLKGEGLIKGDTLYYDYETDLYQLTNAKASFKSLWNSINGSGSWGANPFIWVYTFERIEKPENF